MIPFNRPTLVGSELRYLREVLETRHLGGDGPFSARCESLLEQVLAVPKVFLTGSATHALEMAALLLEPRPGDEVIVPSFTYPSTASAFVLRGARPVFVDVRPDTLNLDEASLEPLIGPRTRAIVVVHYAGVGCEMDAILAIAARHGLAVVEDNALGLFGTYRGRPLGTFGCLAALSFHVTKNLGCGEGGALVINDPGFVERAEIIRDRGTDRARFIRGDVEQYTWVGLGSSYVLSDLLAAFLYAQLEARAETQARRRRIWETYAEQLASWARANDVRLPTVPPDCEPSFHLFYLLLPGAAQRAALVAHLEAHGIRGASHYEPLHRSRMGRRLGRSGTECPVADLVGDRLIRLPFYTELTADDQQRVIETVCRFRA